MPPDQTQSQQRTQADIDRELSEIESATAGKFDANGEPIVQQSSGEPTAEQKAAESLAGSRGWLPKAQYKGDPAKWVDAQTFNERGERFTANLQREVSELRETIKEFQGTKEAFKKFHDETIAKKNAELAETIKQLRIQKSEATREGDHEVAIALEDRIEELNKTKEAVSDVEQKQEGGAKASGPNPKDPVLQEWIEDGNQWFDTDPALRSYAIALGESLIQNGETVKGRKFLDKLRGLMAEEFPRKFAKKETTPPAGGKVSGSDSNSTGQGGGKTEADLPPEDLALMKQFIKAGWTTKEKFLAGYFSGN